LPHTCHMSCPSLPPSLITLTVFGARIKHHEAHYTIFFNLLSLLPNSQTSSFCILTLIRRFQSHRQN
jgi:hypothetical protein